MRLALAQINPTVGDFTGNAALIRTYYAQARDRGADLVIFPELAVCGYPPADLLDKHAFVQRASDVLQELAALTGGKGSPAIIVGGVQPAEHAEGKLVRNVAAVLSQGQVEFTQTKKLLPFYDVFDEQRYFEPAREQALCMIAGKPIALTICEDAWNDKVFWPERRYGDDPVEDLMAQWNTLPPHLAGERLILNISASPFWHGKIALRRRMIAALAKRHRATVVLVNQVGANDSLIFDGSSLVVAADGHVVAQAASFAEELLVVETQRAPLPASAAAAQPAAAEPADAEPATAEPTPEREEHVRDMWQALVLGTRDYVRKCGFKNVLLGLSGGIDSALVAAIAVEALGAEHVRGIGMPSEFSSEGSLTDSERLAQNLDIAFQVMPIRGVYDGFHEVLHETFAGTQFGLAEENLQPRIRGTLLMALSNKTGALVLTTGNKSEMATGYCTLYGDMVGALAVIADVWKTEVYELARYANRDREVIPEATITKPPSAELRPGQKDTDSLPPYEMLDPMLRGYIEEYRTAEEIAASCHVDVELVRGVQKLVERSEYKRSQAAPVLKVSRKSFGSGRRFPIAARAEV